MLEHLKEFIEKRRELREIADMDQRDLDDVGLSRETLAMIVDTPAGVNARLTEMAAVHGVSEEDFNRHREDYATVVETCRHCGATQACAEFLANPDAAAEGAVFCPNHELYNDLARTAR